MVTSNAIQRTFHIKVEAQVATAFSIDIDDKEYFVTAKHVLGELEGVATIAFFHDGQWKELPVAIVGHAADDIDISVFALSHRVVGLDMTLPADVEGMIVGQDVYFLGFPFGLFGVMGAENTHYPLPFVKKGVVSCIEHKDNTTHRIFLDGHNNPGFSGGPVVFAAQGTNAFRAAAVISGYRYESLPIYDGAAELPLSSRHNTGIVVTFGIGYAVALARANPIGAKSAA